MRAPGINMGLKLTTDLSFYSGSSHHQREYENAASGVALADLGLHLWPPKDGTTVSRVVFQQEFLIFHELWSLLRVTDGQAQALTLKHLKNLGCQPL